KAGRDGLGELKSAADMVLADSAFNCRELAEIGFRDPRVLPILVDSYDLEAMPCPRTLARFGDHWTNFLFVGRLVPNKRPEDVIRVFAHYNRYIDRRSRLFLVGSDVKESYVHLLRRLARSLGMEDHIEFTGHVHSPELSAYYRL